MTRLDLTIPGEQYYYVKASTAQERQSWLIALGSSKAAFHEASSAKQNAGRIHNLIQSLKFLSWLTSTGSWIGGDNTHWDKTHRDNTPGDKTHGDNTHGDNTQGDNTCGDNNHRDNKCGDIHADIILMEIIHTETLGERLNQTRPYLLLFVLLFFFSGEKGLLNLSIEFYIFLYYLSNLFGRIICVYWLLVNRRNVLALGTCLSTPSSSIDT